MKVEINKRNVSISATDLECGDVFFYLNHPEEGISVIGVYRGGTVVINLQHLIVDMLGSRMLHKSPVQKIKVKIVDDEDDNDDN